MGPSHLPNRPGSSAEVLYRTPPCVTLNKFQEIGDVMQGPKLDEEGLEGFSVRHGPCKPILILAGAAGVGGYARSEIPSGERLSNVQGRDGLIPAAGGEAIRIGSPRS